MYTDFNNRQSEGWAPMVFDSYVTGILDNPLVNPTTEFMSTYFDNKIKDPKQRVHIVFTVQENTVKILDAFMLRSNAEKLASQISEYCDKSVSVFVESVYLNT